MDHQFISIKTVDGEEVTMEDPPKERHSQTGSVLGSEKMRRAARRMWQASFTPNTSLHPGKHVMRTDRERGRDCIKDFEIKNF